MRNITKIAFLFLAFVIGSSSSFAAPATPEILDELFKVTKVQQLVESSFQKLDRDVSMSAQQIVQQLQLSGEQSAQASSEVRGIQQRALGRIKTELAWNQIRPRFIDLYSRTFSAEEINGMLAFYRTPAGVATIEKMPGLMQQLGQLSNDTMAPIVNQMMQEMQAVVLRYRSAPAAR